MDEIFKDIINRLIEYLSNYFELPEIVIFLLSMLLIFSVIYIWYLYNQNKLYRFKLELEANKVKRNVKQADKRGYTEHDKNITIVNNKGPSINNNFGSNSEFKLVLDMENIAEILQQTVSNISAEFTKKANEFESAKALLQQTKEESPK